MSIWNEVVPAEIVLDGIAYLPLYNRKTSAQPFPHNPPLPLRLINRMANAEAASISTPILAAHLDHKELQSFLHWCSKARKCLFRSIVVRAIWLGSRVFHFSGQHPSPCGRQRQGERLLLKQIFENGSRRSKLCKDEPFQMRTPMMAE